MMELEKCVQKTLSAYYEEVNVKAHQWVDPLTSEQVWVNPFSFGNSVGHLLLHLTGNLNHYIGARIADTGYIRHRDLEFTDEQKRPKEQLLADFDNTIAMVIDTIHKQSAEDWTKPYSGEGDAFSEDRFTALFRCAAHAYHHVGQIIYLAKELTKTEAQSNKQI